jgi:hypothetical protein
MEFEEDLRIEAVEFRCCEAKKFMGTKIAPLREDAR